MSLSGFRIRVAVASEFGSVLSSIFGDILRRVGISSFGGKGSF